MFKQIRITTKSIETLPKDVFSILTSNFSRKTYCLCYWWTAAPPNHLVRWESFNPRLIVGVNPRFTVFVGNRSIRGAESLRLLRFLKNYVSLLFSCYFNFAYKRAHFVKRVGWRKWTIICRLVYTSHIVVWQ